MGSSVTPAPIGRPTAMGARGLRIIRVKINWFGQRTVATSAAPGTYGTPGLVPVSPTATPLTDGDATGTSTTRWQSSSQSRRTEPCPLDWSWCQPVKTSGVVTTSRWSASLR